MALVGLKSLQLLPNAGMGMFTFTNFLHGKLTTDFVDKMGYPSWFPTALGAFKLTQAALNWIAGGAYTHLAQLMMAFQLGGVAFTHGVVEGKSFLASQLPTCVFFSTSVGVQVLNGKLGLAETMVAHTALLGAGFVAGYAIVALGKGGPSAAMQMSPVKWRKRRGF